MKDKKLTIEILDPTGNIVNTHHFHFMAGENNRIRLSIGDNNYILNKDGKLVILTDAEIRREAEIRLERSTELTPELQKLRDWLRSEEGRQAIIKSQEEAEETCKIIDKMRDIDPKLLREPFDI